MVNTYVTVDMDVVCTDFSFANEFEDYNQMLKNYNLM
jgi:hypothetical protein